MTRWQAVKAVWQMVRTWRAERKAYEAAMRRHYEEAMRIEREMMATR